MIALALVLVLSAVSVDEAADRAFREAYGSLDKLEALGAARPITRWTDDAWYEAAQLAERAGDFDRARRDYEAALAVASDPVLRKRAQGMRDRLVEVTGGGRWTEQARRHEELATIALGDGEPQAALRELEQLARANPTYPRLQAIRLTLAKAWEREGEAGRAIGWLRDAVDGAVPARRWPVRLELVRVLVRTGDLDGAERALAQLRSDPGVDRQALEAAQILVDTARSRRWLGRGLWALLAVLAVVTLHRLRRDAGSWRGVGQRLRRPPFEVWFLLPIGAVLSVVSRTGNPLVARAVLVIAIAGSAVSWLSGALLDGAPRPLRARRIALHVLLATSAVAACTYLAVDHDRLIDLIAETWRSGPALP